MEKIGMLEKVRIHRSKFRGRQEVYGRAWSTMREDGKEVRGFAPVCKNFWATACHIRLKDGIRCDKCEIKEYLPVTDESVRQHITGEEVHNCFVLLSDGTVEMIGLDFDYKEGKEKFGFTFEDVKIVSKILGELGVPHGIARSTGEGHHLYIFLSRAYPANKARAIMYHVFELAGFMEQLRQGIRPIPEVFPKQSYAGADGIGNGIKTPMIEPNFAKERNGFVDDTGKFLPAEKQWEYLASIKHVDPEHLDMLIERDKILVLEESPTSKKSPGTFGNYISGKKSGKWQPPIAGSIEKVLEGCAAFRRIRDKCAGGVVPGHNEGMALFHTCMHTSDGMDWFSKNVPGWGKTDQDKKQLDHSVDRNYNAWTCEKMQQNGICIPGTVCFARKPPLDMVDGQMVHRDDIPEDQWPKPSPIRFAYGKGEDFLVRLENEAEWLKDEPNQEVKDEKLRELVSRAQVFDDTQKKSFKETLKKLGFGKAVYLSKLFGQAAAEDKQKLEESVSLREDMVMVDGVTYKKLDPYGYAVSKPSRSKSVEIPLCRVDLRVEEQRTYVDDGKVTNTTYSGTAMSPRAEKKFQIDADKWYDNSEFIKYFGVLLGEAFNVLRQNIDYIRHAAMEFSSRQQIKKSTLLVTQGWHNNSYLMPSVIVDSEGVRPNTENPVDLSTKQHAKFLDFKLISDSEFMDTMMHIKNDLFNAWPRPWVFFGIAHAFMPFMYKPLNILRRPTLFYEGLTGVGKSELTQMLQWFWGDFVKLLQIFDTSAIGGLEHAFHFKDALLVYDDFKGLDNKQKETVRTVIQTAYDGNAGGKCKRTGELRDSRNPRCVPMMSGEEFIASDASVAARSILIETRRHPMSESRDKFNRCLEVRKFYSGVTPKFIHWFLNQDLGEVKEYIRGIHKVLADTGEGRQNVSRIADSLAFNYTSWKLWCDFMLHCGVIDRIEHGSLIEEQWQNVTVTMSRMLAVCEEEQNGRRFTDIFRQMIAKNELIITEFNSSTDHRPDMVIGFMAPNRPNVAYIYSDIAFIKVKEKAARELKFAGTMSAIGRQLYDEKILIEKEEGRYQKNIKTANFRGRVWVVDLIALGVKNSAQGVDMSHVRTGIEIKHDAEGLI